MAQAMEKGRVIELLEYYKDIDGEVSIYRKIINNFSKVVSKVSRPTKGRLLYYSILGGNFG